MGTSADSLIADLRSALGAEAVSADTTTLSKHGVDGVTPSLLVMPQSADQIASAMVICSAARASVIPWGGGTALTVGNPPRQADVVMKLEKLNRLIEHDAANLTVTIQSGMALGTLQSTLAGQKQFVPIDAPFPSRATVGGIVAANLNGPRRGYYGSVRDLVIGMKVVLPSGELIKAGGKVVKNVAGYDMCKLFVGSLGTLGIVTEVTLRLAPLPESAATFQAAGTAAQAQSFLAEVFRSRLLPVAVFLLIENPVDAWRVGVRFEAFTETVKRQLADLEAISVRLGLHSTVKNAEDHEEFWRDVRDFPLRPERLIYRVAVPRAAVCDFVAQLRGNNVVRTVADASVGIVWLECAPERAAVGAFANFESLARQRGGHAVVFSAPGALKRGINVWGATPQPFQFMRDIKRQFDPHELLNPGRFIGGL
jgi:glycolate oxidase FAD binding subunit